LYNEVKHEGKVLKILGIFSKNRKE